MQVLRSLCTILQQQLHDLLVAIMQRYLNWCLISIVEQFYVYAKFQQPLRDLLIPSL
jgi:hypothetical protein